VVYNHFGPEGNYLHVYAPQFFTERHMTPWGAAINYDGEHSYWVRQFFIHNALYWLEEYHFDGLRLDAVHAIMDDSQPDILTELAQRVHDYFGTSRYIHLVLENDHNAAHYLERDAKAKACWYQAQWNDDIHHALHVLLTHETDGYYADYYHKPLRYLGRCLSEGFAYQGELSVYRHNEARGEPSAQLPPTAFVSFLQNHDQVGNRAFGERITKLVKAAPLRAAMAVLLLAPSPPLLFMGEEWGCTQPFPFFCDFGPDLAPDVVAGRRQEFARFPQFSDPAARDRIPDPMNPDTFEQAVLHWEALAWPEHEQWLMLYRELLSLRRREIIPRLHRLPHRHKATVQLSERALSSQWTLVDDAELFLLANLDDEPLAGFTPPQNHILYATHHMPALHLEDYQLPPWSVIWSLRPKDAT
jgi:maltooligosyltrehalose trehalohydrolase